MPGAHLSFFSAKSSPLEREHHPQWLACGSVYQALALSICDVVITSPLSASQPGINQLLETYFETFSNYGGSPHSLYFSTFKQQLQDEQLRNGMVLQLAQILYRLTIENLYRHPTRYHEFALPSEKREYPAHWIASSAPAIIADALGLSISVQKIEAGKLLHASTYYEPINAYKKTLYLQERHGFYSVKVQNHGLFASVSINKTLPEPDAATFTRLITQLDVEIEATLKRFHRVYQRMSKMVHAGELNKEFLMDLYIQNLSFDRLHTGTQAFFDSIHINEEDHTQHMIPELLHAIARLISLGDLEESLVFDQIDEYQEDEHALESPLMS